MPSLFQKCIGQQKKQPCLIFITTVFFTKKTPSLISFRNVFVTNIKQKHHVWYLLQMYWSHKSKETTKSGLFQKYICLKDQKKTPRLVFFRNILVTKVKRKHHVWSFSEIHLSQRSKEDTTSGLFQEYIGHKGQKKTSCLVFVCKQRVCFPPLLLVQVAHTSNENFHHHHCENINPSNLSSPLTAFQCRVFLKFYFHSPHRMILFPEQCWFK